jgi:hypothetical protein
MHAARPLQFIYSRYSPGDAVHPENILGLDTRRVVEVICNSEEEFRRRFGASGNCRQYVMALAWLLCGFERLEHCGIFYQYRLCLKVFGRQSTDFAVSKLDNMMQVLGYVPRDGRNNGIRNAMCMAMLLQGMLN